jgi:hypothetical protein
VRKSDVGADADIAGNSLNVHSSACIPHSVLVGDEPCAHCWSVACYLLTKSQLQLHIDTDPIPPNGASPHPMAEPPLHWLGNGSPPFPRRARVHDQEGAGSCLHREGQPLRAVMRRTMRCHCHFVQEGGMLVLHQPNLRYPGFRLI